MYRIRFVPVVILALALGACSRMPYPAGHPAAPQKVVHSVGHWNILAAATARQIYGMQKGVVMAAEAQAQANDGGYVPPRVVLPDGATFFVEEPDPTMPFAKAFHDMLITQLVAEGVPVNLHRKDAYVLNYAVQMVSHDRGYHKPLAGSLTALGAGVAAVGAISAYSYPGAAGAALALSDLWSSGAGEFPLGDVYSEIVINISLVKDGVLLARRTNTYYVDAKELHQYAAFPGRPLTRYGLPANSEPVGERNFWMVSE